MDIVLYKPQEAAEILKLKKSTIYTLIKNNELRASKLGKEYRISESDLKEFIEKGYQQA